jgi:hypothetical protein
MCLVCLLKEDIWSDAAESHICYQIHTLIDWCTAQMVVTKAQIPHVGNERIMMIDVNELADFFVCVAESDDKL